MKNKYYELLNLLNKNDYATVLFEEYVNDIVIESAITGNEDYYIDIVPADDYIEITVTYANKGEYENIETKKYKNAKSAFNYIKKYMEE